MRFNFSHMSLALLVFGCAKNVEDTGVDATHTGASSSLKPLASEVAACSMLNDECAKYTEWQARTFQAKDIPELLDLAASGSAPMTKLCLQTIFDRNLVVEDRDVAARVLKLALEKRKTTDVGSHPRYEESLPAQLWGRLLAHVNAEGTGTYDAVVAAMQDNQNPIFRSSLVQTFPGKNQSEKVQALYGTLVKSENIELAEPAAQGAQMLPNKCVLLKAAILPEGGEKRANLNGNAVQSLLWERCPGAADTLLTYVRNNKEASHQVKRNGSLLGTLCKAVTEKKAEAASLLEPIVAARTNDFDKAIEIEHLGMCDIAKAKKLAAKLAKSSNPSVVAILKRVEALK